MPAYLLHINGEDHSVRVPSNMPLLWVLRDVLGLTGTKYGCGAQHCGACTVLMDGEPRTTCQLPMAAVGARSITTIEGLSKAGDHPVQRAWIEEQVPQCGYCQSGQILAATALSRRTTDPSDDEIDAALRPHLCRCGTYPRVRRAVRRAAKVQRS